jgi:hypothetical protein
MTDEMAKRLAELPDGDGTETARAPDDPDRQQEAPGAGHTRSR